MFRGSIVKVRDRILRRLGLKDVESAVWARWTLERLIRIVTDERAAGDHGTIDPTRSRGGLSMVRGRLAVLRALTVQDMNGKVLLEERRLILATALQPSAAHPEHPVLIQCLGKSFRRTEADCLERSIPIGMPRLLTDRQLLELRLIKQVIRWAQRSGLVARRAGSCKKDREEDYVGHRSVLPGVERSVLFQEQHSVEEDVGGERKFYYAERKRTSLPDGDYDGSGWKPTVVIEKVHGCSVDPSRPWKVDVTVRQLPSWDQSESEAALAEPSREERKERSRPMYRFDLKDIRVCSMDAEGVFNVAVSKETDGKVELTESDGSPRHEVSSRFQYTKKIEGVRNGVKAPVWGELLGTVRTCIEKWEMSHYVIDENTEGFGSPESNRRWSRSDSGAWLRRSDRLSSHCLRCMERWDIDEVRLWSTHGWAFACRKCGKEQWRRRVKVFIPIERFPYVKAAGSHIGVTVYGPWVQGVLNRGRPKIVRPETVSLAPWTLRSGSDDLTLFGERALPVEKTELPIFVKWDVVSKTAQWGDGNPTRCLPFMEERVVYGDLA